MAIMTMLQVKAAFTADTNLPWDANIHAFIQYYQAKILEQMLTDQSAKMDLLIRKVDDLSSNDL